MKWNTSHGILAWRIWWTEEHGGPQPVRLQRVRHDWATEHTDMCFLYSCSLETLSVYFAIPCPYLIFQFMIFSMCLWKLSTVLFRQKRFLYPFKSMEHRLGKRHNGVDRFMSLLVSRWTLTFSQETNIPCPDWILPFLLLYFSSSLILLCKLCPSSSKSPSNVWDDEHRYQDLDCEQNPVFSPLLFSFTKVTGGKMG